MASRINRRDAPDGHVAVAFTTCRECVADAICPTARHATWYPCVADKRTDKRNVMFKTLEVNKNAR